MNRLCKVCNCPAIGVNFGVVSCRGCASFFRRTIAHQKKYTCNSDQSCSIRNCKNGTICRYCRFESCLKYGMKKELVQTNRDPYGKRTVSFSLSVPIVETIQNYYEHLESVRILVHSEEGQSLFVEKKSKRLNYKETNRVMLKEFHLVSDWITNSFSQFKNVAEEQTNLLIRNFYLQFFILEGAFACHKRSRNDVFFLPNGDFIDCQDLASYYRDPDEEQVMSSEDAARMHKNSCMYYRRNVTTPMISENVDLFEFLTLVALVLFSTGLEGQSESCHEMCCRMRSAVQRELLQYYQNKDLEDVRMGNLLSILPSLQKATYRLHDDFEMSNIFKCYPVDIAFLK